MNALIEKLFLFSVKHREKIITSFKISYLLVFLLILSGSISVYQGNPVRGVFINYAITAGQLSIILYILTIIPGIVRRFGKQNKLVSVLMIYRRYIGILVFFTVLFHYMMERGVSILMFGLPKLPQLFELLGTTAFFGLFLLVITSNDISTKKLGIWWERIHALTYVIVWFMFFHVTLQRISIWSLLLGVAGGIQVLSFYVSFRRRQG